MPAGNRLRRPLVSFLGMLERQAGLLVPGEMFLFSMLLLGDAVCVGRFIVQFGRALMILVVRSVVVACRHKLKTHDLPGFVVGILG